MTRLGDLYRLLQDEVGEYIRQPIYILLRQQGGEVLALNIQSDYVHLLLWIPP